MAEEDLNVAENTKNANGVKEIVLARLLLDKIITKEQYTKYSENYQVIVVKAGWFKTWMKVFNKKSENWYYKYVRFEG